MQNILMSEALDLLNKCGRCDSLDRRLTRRVDIKNQDHICKIECASEIVKQMKGPCVTMRLEDDKYLSEIAGLGGGESRPNLRGVMRVVIDDRDTVPQFHLESPVYTLEAFQ